MRYTRDLEEKIGQIEEVLKASYGGMDNLRWHAVKLLEQDEVVLSDHPVDVSGIVDKDYSKEIINEKYDYSKLPRK